MVPAIDRAAQSPRAGLPCRPAARSRALPNPRGAVRQSGPFALAGQASVTNRSEAATRLLDQVPGLTGVVGTNGADGIPHLVPVWYRWDGGRVHVWTLGSRIWVENLRRDPRVGFSVQEEPFPRRAVAIKGRAEVVTGDDPEIDAEILRITRRYVDESDMDAYIAQNRGLRTMVRISADSLLYRRAPDLVK